MDKETFINTIQSIGTCEDDAERRSLLTSLQDEVVKIYDSNEEKDTTINGLNETITSKEEEISSLQKHNMELFLKVGTPESGKQKQPDIEEEKPKRKFEDLFDEKGMIK